jgi:beta-N-acetylhexosaminidase
MMLRPARQDRFLPLWAGRLLSAAVLLALAVSGVVLMLSRGTAAPSPSPTPARSAAAVGSRPAAGSAAPVVAAPSATAATPPSATAATPRRAVTAVDGLSGTQLAGQRIIYAYAGLHPPSSLLAAIRAGEAAGVIFFANNIASSAQLRGVITGLQRLARAAPGHRSLLMLTDQEGGEVRRLPGPPAASERQIGAAPRASAEASAAGTGAGETLRAAGVNVNLAPVLDVYRRPGDFIDQYARAYSSHPSVVAGLGARFIEAQQRTGVAATAKHFPGLGPAATAQNTDLRPVTLTTSVATLRAGDELPYRSAIAAGVKLVMVSWARYAALDARRPAGLSAAVIGGELRRRLHFGGVTITDGIEAGALAGFGGTGSRAVLAAAAGADLILCAATVPSANSPAIGAAAHDAITSAIASGVLRPAAARAAAARVLALRASAR